MTFLEKLNSAIEKNNSLLCIGLDSDLKKIPENIQSRKNPQYAFNKAIIDKTYDLVSSYKLNTAFYEAQGTRGIEDLKLTFEYIKKTYPDIPTILDAKRADIDNTNKGYTAFAFDYLGADAITLHPYLGQEALKPFLEHGDKGNIILVKTSNKGGGELQNLLINNEPLYKHLAKMIVRDWNRNNNCLMVVGATYPQELSELRVIAPTMTFLIPGIGAQGGDLEKTLQAGLTKDKKGLMIHSARGIIFSGDDKYFAESARSEALKLKNAINAFR
ncbi:MAG TPA: orotidine-5'-phosphate decarboxylase [Candidatus Levybacteria bacterium]|nr:orotidine-5'-phosphate decarboxylase [Candidatus Levybacteria bacterium]